MKLTNKQIALCNKAVKNNQYASFDVCASELKQVLKAMKSGKIYASVDHVSKSGMSRDISFYYIDNKGHIQNIAFTWIGSELDGYRKSTSNKRARYTAQGCGMDMIFSTLYNWHAQLFNKRTNYNDTTRYRYL